MEILIAKKAGFCFGVMRALDITRRIREETSEPVYTYGPIIHNPQVVEKLKKEGIIPLEDLNEVVPKGYLVIRSHGVSPQIVEEARRSGFKIIDATCPYVKRAQQFAKKLVDDGYRVIIIGEKNHPEVQGILGHTRNRAEIYNDDIEIGEGERVGLIAQTTQSFKKLEKVTLKFLPKTIELRVFNTICSATLERQEEAEKLSKLVDIMIVIGGKNSANTTRLAKIAAMNCSQVFHIETSEELQDSLFKNAKKVGVTAGASTPDWIIEEVIKKIKSFKEV